jgi:Spherulation-specific family 4
MPSSAGFSQRRGPVWRRLVLLALAGSSIAAAAACGSSPSATSPPAASSTAASSSAAPQKTCSQLVVPAYFYAASTWAQAADSKPPPTDMILDISGVGAGSEPDAHFTAVVRQVKAKGIAILGYISTVDGQRPAAQVEAEARNYKAWYGVTDIFLDRVSGTQPQAAYYRQLVSYIHQLNPGSSVWLNPGQYPDESYMSIGDVVMVFEGTYAQYLSLQVPGWADRYPAAKFAHTIYDTPGSSLSQVLDLAASRNAGHVYVTDGSGSNPYDGLPGYWTREDHVASAGCTS